MTVLIVYVACLVPFLVLDAVMLKLVMLPLFERHVGDLLGETRLGVALVFYLFYVAGIVWFAVWPGLQAGSMGLAVLNAVILGLVAYGTYEFTNMATLKGWSWAMVATDVTWGGVLAGLTAAIGYWLSARFVA